MDRPLRGRLLRGTSLDHIPLTTWPLISPAGCASVWMLTYHFPAISSAPLRREQVLWPVLLRKVLVNRATRNLLRDAKPCEEPPHVLDRGLSIREREQPGNHCSAQGRDDRRDCLRKKAA